MKKSIFLCASMNFYHELIDIEAKLQAQGWTVYIPQSAKVMKAKNDFEVSHFKGVLTHEQRAKLIQQNFVDISKCDAILVINKEKNGIKGYIGPNVLMEIGIAYYLKKKIYIWNNVPDSASYKDELLCLGTVEINQDLGLIHV